MASQRLAHKVAPVIVAAAVLGPLTSPPILARSPVDRRNQASFDAASIRPHKPDGERARNNLGQHGGNIEIINASLRMLMAQAYNLPSLSEAINTIVGAPKWGDSETFDVEAEAPGSPSVDEKRLMLQSLLADRFKLSVHREKRQRPIYALVLASHGKRGPQLYPHTDDAACQQQASAGQVGAQRLPAGSAAVSSRSDADAAILALLQFPCGRVFGGRLQQDGPNPNWSGGRKVTMETIAASMGSMDYIDRPVVDRTGLTGNFDFTVEWNTRLQDVSVNPLSDFSSLSLVEAFKEQLGLKLQSAKGPVDVLVIDHVEQPSPN